MHEFKYIWNGAVDTLVSIKHSFILGFPLVKIAISSTLAYFLPLKEITHFMIIILFVDIILSVTEQFVHRAKACKFRVNCIIMNFPNWLSCIDGMKLLLTFGKIITYVGALMLLFYFERVSGNYFP
jgi:hypothetical protein